jgi:hypothetical protein
MLGAVIIAVSLDQAEGEQAPNPISSAGSAQQLRKAVKQLGAEQPAVKLHVLGSRPAPLVPSTTSRDPTTLLGTGTTSAAWGATRGRSC